MHNLYTDGGARGNPGPAAIGFVIYDSDGDLVYKHGATIGTDTNNVAEYLALIAGLTECLERGIDKVQCFSDSELMVKQLNFEYKVKKETMRNLYLRVRRLELKFDYITYGNVPRTFEKIKEADAMVNRAMDEKYK